jgi:hypothetical protein
MSETIDLETSKMQVRYRVIEHDPPTGRLLFTSSSYGDAERFCWDYKGKTYAIRIEKVWVRK